MIFSNSFLPSNKPTRLRRLQIEILFLSLSKQLTHVSCIVLLSNIFSLIYNLTMNRPTNKERLQFIEFDYQNACPVKKVHCSLLPFYGQFNRSNSYCWTLHHQHAYIECNLKKISQLYRPVLMIAFNYRFVNCERYREVISHNARAACQTTCVTSEFGEHFISHSGPVNWPHSSCGLTYLDYFL